MATIERFLVEDFAEELAAAEENLEIGTALLFENDRIRAWEVKLAPGERVPFHHHRTAYLWICIDGGHAIQRYPDGHLIHVEFAAHDTDYLDEERLLDERIHDLENTGDTTFRFHAFELVR
jgi:oxalate decarboxylase/phosphoglucose isomerase-like protein (cupin superfamily)